MSRSTIKSDAARTKSFALDAAKLMSELKCSDVVILDLVGRSQICDYMLIASGTSQRQMKSVGEAIDKLGKTQGSPAWRTDADTGTSWIVVDFVDVVAHLSSQHSALSMTSKDFGLTRRAWLGVQLRRHLAEILTLLGFEIPLQGFRKLKK